MKFFIIITLFIYVTTDDIYHEGSRMIFKDDFPDSYFGYSVILRDTSPPELVVGAPRAASKNPRYGHPGAVYTCDLSNLPIKSGSLNCTYINLSLQLTERERNNLPDYYKDDMWFGATVTAVTNGSLVVCAPRWTTQFQQNHRLANGLCYIISKRQESFFVPLKDTSRQAYRTDGLRKEYGENGIHLNYYAYAQPGISAKITDDQTRLILGAPGLLQWTGGVVHYEIFGGAQDFNRFGRQVTANPYFTKELEPDGYFGYSVESGIFKPNSSTLFVASAPRGHSGYGQVLIFSPSQRETSPLTIHAKMIGPQLGAYFGAALCSVDLNGDGRNDILVGAPNFVAKGDGNLHYDQGAVFVYLSREEGPGFKMELVGNIKGSETSGARFGNAIANLGDLDGDGYPDIAVGAPWEDSDRGAVYVYRGGTHGLHASYIQRISPIESKGFGIAIARGLNVDNHACNELAVGAFSSCTAYLFRCIPTVVVKASIKVPGAMDLPQNATDFAALSCVYVHIADGWPSVQLELIAKVSVDLDGGRAHIAGDTTYTIKVRPGTETCEEQTVNVHPRADLSRPIALTFEVEAASDSSDDSSVFPLNRARLSEDSELHSSFDIQLTRDCGEDMICQPKLGMSLELLSSSPYIPGLDQKLGVVITIKNLGEPCYGAMVYVSLPLSPQRIPSGCTYKDLNLTCDLPAPLHRFENVSWNIELEYTQNSAEEVEIALISNLNAPYLGNNETDTQEIIIKIRPEANFSVQGQPLPNSTLSVSRSKLSEGSAVIFIHSYEILNLGPSDWPLLKSKFILPLELELVNNVTGCTSEDHNLTCLWDAPARVSLPVALTFRFDINRYGEMFSEKKGFNATTEMVISQYNISLKVTTVLELELAPPIWPHVVGLIAGLLVLSTIVYVLYKRGFFMRQRRDDLRKLKEAEASPTPGTTSDFGVQNTNDSTDELLLEDSD